MSGRSRGRARTITGPQPTSAQPPTGAGGLQSQSGESKTPSPTGQPPSPPSPPTPPSPQTQQQGRGRGFTTTDAQITSGPPSIAPSSTLATTAATTSGRTGAETTQSSGDSGERISPTSEGSPPQQHSPPQGQVAAIGRAALRGGPHQPAPSATLTAFERMSLQDSGQIAGQQRGQLRFEQVLHTRPPNVKEKCGTAGTPVKILCNYFEILNKPDWILYQYHVDYMPVVESKKMRIALLRNHDALFTRNKAFDGSTLYSLTKLDDEITEVASTRETDQQIITIKIKRICEVAPTSPQFVHLFNVVFRRCLKLYGMKLIDRNYFDMNSRISIPEYRIDLINGFATSIASYETKLLLCAELTHKLLHQKTIWDLLGDIWKETNGENQFKERATNELVGRIIMTKYNDKTYKIDDIDWGSSPKSSFPLKYDRGTITFLDYYKKQYSITIRDEAQPLLISLPNEREKRSGQTTPFKLVPELCIVTGVDDKMREDFRFKKAIDQYTKIGARERCNRLTNFVNTFNRDERVQTELQKWEMNFSGNPASINGRTLPFESIGFGNAKIVQLNEKADWSNEIKQRLLAPVDLNNWLVVYPQNRREAASSFINLYGQVISAMGIGAQEPKEISIRDDSPQSYTQALKSNITSNIQLVVIILTSKRKDRYDSVKRICCLENPVPSQVVTAKILEDARKARSVVTKVAIQMNCKLGGEIWKLNIPIQNVMICGIDTYHDSAKKKGSVCAFIATSNEEKTKFFSRASLQESHQELSTNLTITVKSAIDHYYRCNKKHPEKIIIYRDGVSDGQLPLVMDYEIPQIKKAFELIDPSYIPLLAFIVVKKRGNARFFAQRGNETTNPPCGTIIDSVVTRAEWFDFYLISQNVNQGTVNPTHYNIVYDTIGLKPDHYQRLSYKLTHLYYNWPGTIRVPAVCQYAHKLAFLVGQSLHKEHHMSLSDKLYYL